MPFKTVNNYKGSEVVQGIPVPSAEEAPGLLETEYNATVSVKDKRFVVRLTDSSSTRGLQEDLEQLPPMSRKFVKKLLK